jgi:hypothetical protein
MAGSFGYARDHYDVSRRSANASCSPPSGQAEGDVVVAAGTSCRHQIHDFTGETALHPAYSPFADTLPTSLDFHSDDLAWFLSIALVSR